ncbi:hypothetical protein K0M31_003543 [Melipona bicolor]|uniref:Uncharacterized protein n=1 Tax=Melipona bicolor TaxID=60889 RepID=A0AA40FZQ7_9HYME|nr:hypothetical protein K0M31_003543 [Melipona bicolor]
MKLEEQFRGQIRDIPLQHNSLAGESQTRGKNAVAQQYREEASNYAGCRKAS